MDIHQFTQLLKARERELKHYMSRKLPVKAGAKAKSFVQENFRKGGFQDQFLEKWPLTRRQLSGGKSADSKRGPLLSSRKVLYSSTNYKPGNGSVTIYNNTIYAKIHNEGGSLKVRVTKAMRSHAWKEYYKAGGGGKGKKGSENSEASFWKGLALTKKTSLTINIPKRQFIGESKTLNDRLQTMIKEDLTTILTQK